MNQDKLNLSVDEKVSLFDKLCAVNQNEVVSVLRDNGFQWFRGRKATVDYSPLDQKIVDVLSQHPEGVKLSVLQFLVIGNETEYSSAQFGARVGYLTKVGQLSSLTEKRGYYTVANV